MKNVLTAGAALLLTTTLGHAAGLDRSGQPVGLIFEDGNVVELSFGYVMPEVTGEITNPALGPAFGLESGDVASDYLQLGGGVKIQQTDELSFALIFDQPFGAAVKYDEAFYPLDGTEANVTSNGYTALVRYAFDENYSVHGGLRLATVEGDFVRVVNGTTAYQSTYSADTGNAFVLGGAYERKDIALRLAVTYTSEMEFALDGTNGDLSATIPESINVDFQTGIAADTLLFGSVRYVAWDGFVLDDSVAGPLVSYDEDGYTYNIGVGRRFSDVLSGSVSVGYEAASDEPSSNLAPSDGYVSLSVGGEYQLSDNVALSGGIRYVQVGDTTTNLGASDTDTTYEDNSAIAIGAKVAYSF